MTSNDRIRLTRQVLKRKPWFSDPTTAALHCLAHLQSGDVLSAESLAKQAEEAFESGSFFDTNIDYTQPHRGAAALAQEIRLRIALASWKDNQEDCIETLKKYFEDPRRGSSVSAVRKKRDGQA